ncbi:MAG: histidine phosphatase family protein [Chloroflexota bacterium]|nr:histidine phosphatase family protein [Chloroflexota bacterium]
MLPPEPSELPRLYFVRHGESHANREHVFSNRDLPHGLTQTGRAQVERLAEQLIGVSFTGFYVSPVLRARQSASILAARLGLAYTTTAALAEFDMGVLEGRSDAASWRRYEALLDTWLRKGERQTRIEGGESFDDIRARFVPLIDGLMSAPQRGPALLLGHGGTFICMLPLVLSNVSADFARERSIEHTEVVIAEMRAARLTCLAWGATNLVDA